MIHKKIILAIALVSGSAFGMEQAIIKLKADVFQDKYSEDFKNGTILHAIYSKDRDALTESLVQEFVKRGVDLNKKDKNSQDLYRLISGSAWDKEESMCRFLYKLGASVNDTLKRQLSYFGDSTKQYILKDRGLYRSEQFTAELWFHQQRKQFLKTYLLTMNCIKILPKDLVRMILKQHFADMIPTHCLPTFYSKDQVTAIKALRDKEVLNLFEEFRSK